MARPIVGETSPVFSLRTGGGASVTSSDYLGEKAIVLYFYPKDDTPGCTREACDFRDLEAEFAAADAVILGISKDSEASHAKFSGKFTLNFPLLSDPEGTACAVFGVWVEKMNYGKKYMGIERTTFVIGKDGNIKAVFPKVKVDGHAAKVLTAIKDAE
jgi:peroxiredoxin Q/BCP